MKIQTILNIFIYTLTLYILYCILNYQTREQFNASSNLSINNKIYIIVPCYNFENFIKICILSIQKQTYTNYKCFFINDGSTDMTGKYIDMICNKDPRFVHYKYSKNKGPAFGKYIGFEKVKEVCTPNDICIVVDGDDYLLCEDALEHINSTYNKTKCWCTYGSTIGRLSYLEKDVNDPNVTTITNYRKGKWYYGHPNTFKTYILNFFTKSDFLYKDNTWLQKGTDINYIFKCLEFSGKEKIKFITKKLYYYRTHAKNTRKVSSKKRQFAHIDYAKSKPAIPKHHEKIHIVWCVTTTLHFNKLLNMINKQSINNRIILHILLNKNIKSNLNLPKDNPIIFVEKLSTENYSTQVFEYIQNLRKIYFIDYIIYLENQYNIDNMYIEKIYNLKLPETMIFYNKLNTNISHFIIDASIFDLVIVDEIPTNYTTESWLLYICRNLNWEINKTNFL